MIIKSVYMLGFKGYKESVYFEFPDFEVNIEGKNGEGKTSIGDAICWCLYGTNLKGTTNADTELMNKESEEMVVRCEVELEPNNFVKITRLKRKSLTLKYEVFDGNNYVTQRITQKQLNEILPPKNLFISIFNPEYFLNQSNTNARKQLIDMLPKINIEDILNSYNAIDKFDYINKYPSVNVGIKEVQSQIKLLKDELLKKTGELSTLNELIAETKSMTINEIQVDTSSLEKLNNELIHLTSSGPTLIDTKELELKISDLNNQIKIISSERYYSDNNSVSSLVEKVNLLKGQLVVLNDNHTKINSLQSVCSECGQHIDEIQKNNQLKSIENNIFSIESQINSLNKSIELLSKIENDKKDKFENDKQIKINIINDELNNMKLKLSTIIDKNNAAYEEYNNISSNRIAELKSQIAAINKNKQLQEENKIIELQKAKNISIYDEKIRITKLKISDIENSLNSFDIELNILKEYSSQYVNYISNILKSWLNKVSIRLYKVNNTTGELKDDFSVFYEGKSYNILSCSEKIKAGLEVSNMLNKSLDITIPVFIDNGECILDIPPIDTQKIVTKVKKCNIKVLKNDKADIVNQNDENKLEMKLDQQDFFQECI